uniref:THAP-type domain-containing protein n=1 Tax=Plectus sambesii TaxID=2011161 RepID=A0A914W2I7_9BILA
MEDESGESDYQDDSAAEFSAANDAVAELFATGSSRKPSQQQRPPPSSSSSPPSVLLTKSGQLAKRSARCMVANCLNRADGVTRWKNEHCATHGRRKGDCPCRVDQPFQLFHLNRNTRRMTLAFCELVLPEALLEPILTQNQNPSQHWRVCSDHFAMEQSGDKNAVPILGLQRTAADIRAIAEKYDVADSLPPNLSTMDLSIRPLALGGRFKIPRDCGNMKRSKRSGPLPISSPSATIESQIIVEREEKARMHSPGAEHDKHRGKLLAKRKRVSQMCSVDECCVTNLTRQPRIGKLPYHFFPLPNDPDLASQWIEASKSSRQDQLVWWKRYQDALEQGALISRYCPFHVCEKHFLDGEPSIENPIPTLFMPKDTPKLADADRKRVMEIVACSTDATQKQSPTEISPQRCIVHGCSVRSDLRVPNLKRLYRLYRMPSESSARAAWLTAVVRDDPNFELCSSDLLTDLFACERHFSGGKFEKDVGKSLQQGDDDHGYSEGLSGNYDDSGQSQQCLVRCCPVASGMLKTDNTPYRFIPVPKTTVARAKWFDSMHLEDPLFKAPVAMYADDQFHLCERHFVPTSIRPNPVAPKATVNVVPTLNLAPASSANIDLKGAVGHSQTSSPYIPTTNRKVASYLAPHTKSRGQRGRSDSWCCRDIPALKYSMSKLTSRIDSLYLMICQLYTSAGYEVPPENDGLAFGQFSNLAPLPVGDVPASGAGSLLDALNQLKSEVIVERTKMDDASHQVEKQESAIEMDQELPREIEELRGSQRRKLIKPGPKSFKKRKIAEMTRRINAVNAANAAISSGRAVDEGPLVSVETTEGEDLSAQFAGSSGPATPAVGESTTASSADASALQDDQMNDGDEQIVPEI